MASTSRALFAFVDLADPFMTGEVADEEQPGPILSIMSARQFESLFLFSMPHTRENALATRDAVRQRHNDCEISVYELPVSDPKDYSSLMGSLARQIKALKGGSRATDLRNDRENYVCVSSGTAEMRAAWFLLTAAGFLPAKLLQLGSPTRPLFGAPNVKEVRFEMDDWAELRELLLPTEYFVSRPTPVFGERAKRRAHKARELHERAEDFLDHAEAESGPAMAAPQPLHRDHLTAAGLSATLGPRRQETYWESARRDHREADAQGTIWPTSRARPQAAFRNFGHAGNENEAAWRSIGARPAEIANHRHHSALFRPGP
ncbi:MAG: hypothetical protein JO159_04905 [Acidobacteria bacterium]|nr:hypothetical protein [Acidobacteriota bacterium]